MSSLGRVCNSWDEYRNFYSKSEIYIDRVILPQTMYENYIGFNILVEEVVHESMVNNSNMPAASGIPYQKKERILGSYFAVFSGIEDNDEFLPLKHVTSFETIEQAKDYIHIRYNGVNGKVSQIRNFLRIMDLSKVKWDLLPENNRSITSIENILISGKYNEFKEVFVDINFPYGSILTKEEANLKLDTVKIEVELNL